MTCPQCQHRISVKALWTRSGFAGVTCPNCTASLCPKPLTALLVFALSIGLGDAALLLLRRSGADFPFSFAGFFLIFAAVFAVAGPLLLQMRLKDHGRPAPDGHRVG